MKTACPFCNEPYDIDNSHLERHLECYKCHNKFKCSLVAIPKIGTMYLNIASTADPIMPDAEISCIVWWSNQQWHSWVKGHDTPDEFIMFWSYASRVVTFDGKSFDEPQLCRQFHINPHKEHIELRQVARQKRMSGGIKALGEVFELPRVIGLDNVDSEASVKLWKLYEKNTSDQTRGNLLYCCAWNVVLTYHLYCFFSKGEPVSIQNSIPFTLDLHFAEGVDAHTPNDLNKSEMLDLAPEKGMEDQVFIAKRVRKNTKPKKKIIIIKKG